MVTSPIVGVYTPIVRIHKGWMTSPLRTINTPGTFTGLALPSLIIKDWEFFGDSLSLMHYQTFTGSLPEKTYHHGSPQLSQAFWFVWDACLLWQQQLARKKRNKDSLDGRT